MKNTLPISCSTSSLLYEVELFTGFRDSASAFAFFLPGFPSKASDCIILSTRSAGDAEFASLLTGRAIRTAFLSTVSKATSATGAILSTALCSRRNSIPRIPSKLIGKLSSTMLTKHFAPPRLMFVLPRVATMPSLMPYKV
uniref:Uncharacterized protein n=1 Tax=Trichogramma kaykai TaxID=54128 RepID=A0ABD2VVN0_9HYME